MKKKAALIEIIDAILLISSFTLLLVFILIRNDYGIAVALAINLFFLLFNIVKSLVKKEPNQWFDWLETGSSIIMTIIIIVVFASISPLEIKDAVVQISSAVIGGSLTLYGVGITIKYSRIEKEKEEIKKARPVVFPISEVTWGSIPKEKRNDIYIEINKNSSELKPSNSENAYSLFYLLIANSDASLCGLFGMLINGKIIKFEYEQIMAKNSNNQIIFESTGGYKFSIKSKINNVSLLLLDMLGNIYECVSRFEIDKYKVIKINAFLETKLYKSSESSI